MPIRAFILVTTLPGKSHEIVTSRRIRGVKIAASVFGQYDAVLMVEVKDLKELSRVVYELVERHPAVVHTETLVSLFPPGTHKP